MKRHYGIPLPTLDHAARQRIINDMFWSFRVVERKTHAGTLIDHELMDRHAYSRSAVSAPGTLVATIEDLINLWETT